MAGRVRERLAKIISLRLEADGFQVKVDPEKLWPAEGFWRIDSRADCYRWEGQIEVLDPRGGTTKYYSGGKLIRDAGKWQTIQIGSYSTMTACLGGVTYFHEGFAIVFDAID